MYQQFYILVLCLLMLGGSLAAKKQNNQNNGEDWQYSNTMSREDGDARDVINIDEMHTDMVDGSGKEDGDMDNSSGHGPDDEDSEDGSADSSAGMMHPEPESTAVPTLRPGKKDRVERPRIRPTEGYVPVPEPTEPEDNNNLDIRTQPPMGPKTTTEKNNVVPGVAHEETNKSEKSDSFMTDNSAQVQVPFMSQPGILAAVIGGAVVGLLCAVLFVMFIVYRMRKKDEGSYALDEPKKSPSLHAYSRPSNQEFYA